MEMLKINAVCEGCKVKFEVSKNNLKSVDTNERGRSITITYYDCPNCGRSHFVQADDDATKIVLEECSRQMAKLMVARKNGTVSMKAVKRFDRKRKSLTNLRHKLMGELTGRKIKVNGEVVELRFSL